MNDFPIVAIHLTDKASYLPPGEGMVDFASDYPPEKGLKEGMENFWILKGP